MLRKTRIVLAALFLIGITLLFLGIGQNWWGWMAKLQFLPSSLALNFTVIIGILLLTVLFGRVYLLDYLSSRHIPGHCHLDTSYHR